MSEKNDRDWLTIKQAIEQLPHSLEPPRDQWAAIRSRIEADIRGSKEESTLRYRYPHWMPYAVAASLLLAVVSSIFSWKTMNAYQALQQQQVALFEQQQSLQWMAQQHQLVKAHFLEEFAQLTNQLDPAVVADVRNNLVVIEQALADLQRALMHDPGNPRLNELLIETYAHERQLIEQMKSSYFTI